MYQLNLYYMILVRQTLKLWQMQQLQTIIMPTRLIEFNKTFDTNITNREFTFSQNLKQPWLTSKAAKLQKLLTWVNLLI